MGLYDENGDGVLSVDEVRAWVRDMCGGDGHVDRMIDRCMPSILASGAETAGESGHSLATISPSCIAAFQELGLEPSDVLKRFVHGQQNVCFRYPCDSTWADTLGVA